MRYLLIFTIFAFIFCFPSLTFAQGEIKSEHDTLVVLKKDIAKEILSEYDNLSDLKTDLMKDNKHESMVTDRPHIAETPHLATKNYLYAEMGFDFENTDNKYTGKNREITYNTTLLRLGLSRRIELRAEMAYMGSHVKALESGVLEKYSGFSALSLGSKIHLFKANKLIPEAALLYGITLPYFGAANYKPNYTVASMKFLFLNRLARWYELEYNIGYEWGASQGNASYAYAVNNEFELSKQLYFFAEIYGYLTENSGVDNRFNGTVTHDHRLNAGVWYLFTPNFQLDFSGGVGLSKISPDYYVSFGVSNRFCLKKK